MEEVEVVAMPATNGESIYSMHRVPAIQHAPLGHKIFVAEENLDQST